jgi:dTDP-glucose 4,6-dehydratase
LKEGPGRRAGQFSDGIETKPGASERRRTLSIGRHDIVHRIELDGPVDAVINMASPASPKDYLEHSIETLDVGSAGTPNMLELARRHGARFLLTSTSECYGDPHVHPQVETTNVTR